MSRPNCRRPKFRSPAPVVCQALEPRQLLSATLSQGLLTVTGTSKADKVVIFRRESNPFRIVVRERRGTGAVVATVFRANRVHRIAVDLGNGNDVFSFDESFGEITGERTIHGNAGDDLITGGAFNDALFGDAGDDTINGGGGRDVIIGGDGDDSLHGGEGADSLYGVAGADTLVGDNGADSLDGGNGIDTVDGIQDPPPPAPSTPANFTATARSASTIRLTWLDVVGEDNYKLERSPDGVGSWVQIAAPAMDVTRYVDTGLNANTTYYYRLTAVNTGGSSAPTVVASATTDVDTAVAPPVTPVNFVAAAQSSTDIQLTWTDNPDETSYILQRRVQGAPNFTTIKTLIGGTNGFLDTGLTGGTVYEYQLIAANAGGNSAPASASDMTL